jgi:hypothetical protein
MHSELHVFINEAGAGRGIPKKGSGEIDGWFEVTDNDLAADLIQESLMEAYIRFDVKHGTTLVKQFTDDLRRIGRIP